eukprot:8790291-Ditylum_brightwellii.AAC.1
MGRFTPPHLNACGHDNHDFVFVYCPFLWQDVTEVPCIIQVHGKAPEAVFNVQLDKCKRASLTDGSLGPQIVMPKDRSSIPL